MNVIHIIFWEKVKPVTTSHFSRNFYFYRNIWMLLDAHSYHYSGKLYLRMVILLCFNNHTPLSLARVNHVPEQSDCCVIVFESLKHEFTLHRVPLATSSVKTSTRLQQKDFFASKSFTTMLKSCV